jgi:predicted tellurium resistance membrane protein TerC
MEFFAPLWSPAQLPGLISLTVLEIVLGIDNIIFISILAGKLPADKQPWARRMGLGIALLSRIALLVGLWFLMHTGEAPSPENPNAQPGGADLFNLWGHGISIKDLVLILGGLFLTGKAVHEIYENVERPAEHQPKELDKSGTLEMSQEQVKRFMVSFLVQVALLDIVFSLDSVITAVGINDHLVIMITAVLLAIIVMVVFAKPIGDFVQQHASIRVLALAFLVMIGTLLIAEGFDQHVEKGYIYFSMGFALSIEVLNMRMRSRKSRWQEDKATPPSHT